MYDNCKKYILNIFQKKKRLKKTQYNISTLDVLEKIKSKLYSTCSISFQCHELVEVITAIRYWLFVLI